MSITLTPRTEALIRERLKSGRYTSAEEVIEAAILLLEARDRSDRLRDSLIEAEEQVRAGRTLEWTPELRQQLREDAAAMVRQGVRPDPDVCP